MNDQNPPNDPVKVKMPVGTPLHQQAQGFEDPFIKAFDDLIARTLIIAPTPLKETIYFMQKYVIKMAPEQNNDSTTGASNQLLFFRTLKNLIERSTPETFNKSWNIVLSFFWRYKNGALGERYVNRFSEDWTMGDPNLTYFQRLINLCLVSANPSERLKVTKKVNVPKTVEAGFTPSGVQNILQFYKV
ncbi:MAG TPA: hypothetical protein VN843_01540 [Anaerolineales bacterium]|nr:hypothetical protein [Anaerolineales bacterium]